MANVEVRANQTSHGVPIYNIMNWQLPDTSALTYQEMANTLRAQWDTHIADSFHASWSLNSVTFREFDGGAPFSTEVGFSSGPLAGTGLGEALPRQTALLVSLQYNGGRPNRGRQFYGGLSENAWDGTEWDATTAADFLAFWGVCIGGFTLSAGNAFPRIARKDLVSNTWVLNNPIEAAIVRPYASTQRGRRS